ncbi:hypothetical protein [Saccharibacillus alkalitolerans]|uniref:Tissue inhibitor of metalloproteinase n=1 Tax=Saccharibacillus alkalitolerans TaxID=2705290 RepID=A0ABX0FAJ5_9BACL|nr:hypothetical protein [Saccharibacillus alkalitolerans]NGZ76989.1 hypothetical protein [Saccharibacillus alkalitolerans]
MRNIGRVALVFVLLVLSGAAAFSPGRAAACSCIIPDNARAAMEKSAAVFAGTVESVKTVRKGSEAYYKAEMKADESWKGVDEANVTVYSDFGSCSFGFETGKRYLIYAYDNQERLDVINCGRSGKLMPDNEMAAADLKELGTGTRYGAAALQGDGGASDTGERNALLWAGGAVVLLGVCFIVWRTKRKGERR